MAVGEETHRFRSLFVLFLRAVWLAPSLAGAAFRVSSDGASPSMLRCSVVSKVALASLFSHVMQPSASVKFDSVFSGLTEFDGHVSEFQELGSVELESFEHTSMVVFSVEGLLQLDVCFSWSLVGLVDDDICAGFGFRCLTMSAGDWMVFYAWAHPQCARALPSCLLVVYFEAGTQESSLLVALHGGVRLRGMNFAAAMLFKSVLAESCAALWRAAVSEGVLATLFFGMYRCCYGRHACLHTSCNGECKGKSSGSIQEDKASFLQVLLKTLQVVREGSAACIAFLGFFVTAAACRTTAAALLYVASLFAAACVLVPVFVGSLLILVGWLQLIGACVLGLRRRVIEFCLACVEPWRQFGMCAAAALGLYAATSRWTAAAAAAALNIRDTLVFDEVQTSDLVTTTLSPSKGPRVAFQAKATPRVDVAEVPSVPSSQQALCVKSCFVHFPGSFGDDTPGSLVTPPSGLSFMLVTLSGKTLTMNEDAGILVSELLDKIAGLSALPTSAFYTHVLMARIL